MYIPPHKIASGLLIWTLAVTSSAQQAPPLSKNAAAVKLKADHLSPRAPISVVRLHEAEEFGTFVSNNQEGFTFRDVDRKTDVTLSYAEVRKIKDGYGGYNSLQGRHTDHTKALIIGAVVVGGLVALIVAAAASK